MCTHIHNTPYTYKLCCGLDNIKTHEQFAHTIVDCTYHRIMIEVEHC